MRAWKVMALSMAVLIATALLLRIVAGPAVPGDLAAQTSPTGPPVAVDYVMQHPSVANRLSPLLDGNVAMADAAQGFTDPIMFAAVVHAADNLNVPFVLLKQRVLASGTSLLDAIRAIKPNVDAGSEAQRAYNQARYTMGR
jgi:hypothetical protein